MDGGDDGLADLGPGPGDEDAGGGCSRRRAPSGGDGCGAERGRARGRRRRPASRPRSSSPARWVAITVKRRREEPSGTVGGRIPWAKTPRSRTRSQSSIVALRRRRPRSARSGSASRRPPSPSAASAARRRRAFVLQALDPLRLGRRSSSAGAGGGDRGRRRGGREDEGAGGVEEEVDGLGAGADVGAVGAERLAERADDDVDLAAEAGGGDRAAPAGAERPGRVRLVDHQPAAVAAGQLEQLRQRRDVAVHREDAVGDDQRAAPAGLAQPPGEVLEVAVAVDEGLGAGEPAAVDDAGVVELVGEDDLALARPGRRSRRCWRGSRSRTAAPPRSP